MRATLVSLSILLASCGPSALTRLAKNDDRAALSEALSERIRAGTLSNREAASVAREVIRRDFSHMNEVDAETRVVDLVSCAADVDDVLRERQSRADRASPRAAMIRVDSGAMSLSDARDYLRDKDEGFRAVGTRALVREEDADERRKAFVDPSPRVRRAAILASRAAKDARDTSSLVEVARLDPEAPLRSGALQNLAFFPEIPASVIDSLRDLWAAPELRDPIAFAWARPELYGKGGRDALRVRFAGEVDESLLGAAATLVRKCTSYDGDTVSLARAFLGRVAEGGSQSQKLRTIASAPLALDQGCDAKPIENLLIAASKSDAPSIRHAAWTRLAELETHRTKAIAALLLLAKDSDASLSSQARFSLASLGHLPVQAWLEEDLAAIAKETPDARPDARPDSRIALAAALSMIGRSARAARLLTDDDSRVRARVACILIVGGKNSR